MSATALETGTTRAAASAPVRTTTARVLVSEWIKLRTLRSTWAYVVGTLIVLIGFGMVAALTASGQTDSPGGGPAFSASDPVSTTLTGANLAVLVVAVMGSIVGAREYSTGMIRTTLAAVPRRLPVLWGKLATFTGLMASVVVTGVVVAFFAGMAVLDAGGAATMAWSDDGVARAVLGTAANVVGLGVMGLALGVMLRSTAAAIGTVIGAVLFIPTLASALLPDSWDDVLKYLPSNAAQAFTSLPDSGGTLLGPGAGIAVFAAWVLASVVGAAVVLKRRDA
jgi:ABC-type transport system involved in multi-copper enzyme maturation permease subunit